MLDGPVGAYLHVPFCERICPFCPYNKVVPRPGEPAEYFEALTDEVQRYLGAGAAGPAGFTSLYVGGGTPTLYPQHLADLVARLPVAGERAIEVLPTHGTAERLAELRDIGFTAVSIGAQSFHPEVLRRLRRPHDAEQARSAVAEAVGRFPLVDVDLIVDVELDDELGGAFLADLAACMAMGADQVSTYPLMRFGYTPFGRARHDQAREHAVLREATQIAHARGFERRSVWTFNRRGSPTYTSITRRRFLGMGAGASSYLGRDFLVNHFGLGTYIADVRAGRLPVARWLRLAEPAGMAYDAFWQAYAGRIDRRGLAAGHGPWSCAVDLLAVPLRAAGWLQRADGAYLLTPRGFDHYHDLERWVTYQLIEPLWAESLAEHAAEGRAATWARLDRGRRGRLWRLAAGAMGRPTSGQRPSGPHPTERPASRQHPSGHPPAEQHAPHPDLTLRG